MRDPILRVTYWGALINIILSGAKIFLGWTSGSVAVLADGFHSLSDLISDVAVVCGVAAAKRPADQNHPYGHGKYETVSALAVALLLVGVGFYMIWEASRSMYRDQHAKVSVLLFGVTVISIVSKESLYWWTVAVAKRVGSSAAMANAWHHRSDALSSVAVLVGLGMSQFGILHGDQMAGAVVGAMIIYAGGKILADSILQLTDSGAAAKYRDALAQILDNEPEVKSWHAWRGRQAGREIFMDCHILVDPAMTVQVSHDLTEHIQQHLRELFKDRPVHLLLHVEPWKKHGNIPDSDT
jgi:cation diffusion facilitator family transporter